MCNLYSVRTNPHAIADYFRARTDRLGNMEPMPGIFPDYRAPIIRRAPDGEREAVMMRWGMPSPKFVLEAAAKKRADKLAAKGKPVDMAALLAAESDSGVTNIRNVKSPHWRRWLGPANRCLVPMTSFSENEEQPDGSRPPVWFAQSEDRPLAAFAGIYVESWTSVRKIKEGPTTNDLFGFLTCDPNAVVAPIHIKAMPVILRDESEFDVWLNAPQEVAMELQRPLPDDALRIVARGAKQD